MNGPNHSPNKILIYFFLNILILNTYFEPTFVSLKVFS